MNVSESFDRSSVSRAVISFVVEAIERRSSAAREQATMPVETSMTIALGARACGGQAGSAACAPGAASAATAAAAASRPVARRSRLTAAA